MEQVIRDKILGLLADQRTMSIGTLRPDGWPQVTTVGYANVGLTIYFLCGRESQKAANLLRDPRVSLAIDNDPDDVLKITGLSMAARAERVRDAQEAVRAMKLLLKRYPPQPGMDSAAVAAADVIIFRLTPTVVSVLDYSKGFGHADLVHIEPVQA